MTLTRFFLLVLLLFLLVGCSPVVKTAAPTALPETLLTGQPQDEPTPTLIPQVEPTPTAIPDPTRPAEGHLEDPDPQPDTWFRAYGEEDNMGSDVIMAPDGGFYIVGGTSPFEDGGKPGGVLLIRTDPIGNELWRKVYGGEEYDVGWSIIQMVDGDYFIAGQTGSYGSGGMDAFLIKVDPEGNEIWSRTFGGPLDEYVNKIIGTADGGYVLVGNIVDPQDVVIDNPGTAGYGGFAGRSSIHLVKVDGDGNLQWSKTYESEENVISSGAVKALDGDLLVLASVLHYPDFDSDIILMKVAGDGSEVWRKTWEEGAFSGHDIIATTDQHYLITGLNKTDDTFNSDLLLIKLDAKGEEIWQVLHGDPEMYEGGNVLVETSGGDYVILGYQTSSLFDGTTTAFLFRFDRDGGLLHENAISLPPQYSGKKMFDIFEHPQGGFIISGTATMNYRVHNTILIKTNAFGVTHD